MSLRPTPADKVSAFEILIRFLIAERTRKEVAVNQLNQNHNTVILLLVILTIALGAGLGALILFTVLI